MYKKAVRTLLKIEQYYICVTDKMANQYWEKIKNYRFHFVQLTNPFSIVCCLSSLRLQHKYKGYVCLSELVEFDTDVLTKSNENKEVNVAVNSLLLLLQQGIVQVDCNYSDTEKYVLYTLVDKIFQHIASSVTLERRVHSKYVKRHFRNSEKIGCGDLGIGCNQTTWYGTVDGRLRGTSSSFIPLVSIGEDYEDEDEDSDGSSLVMEMKAKIKQDSQSIGSVVLSSFIEHNRHPSLNPLVPCILINCSTLKVFLYDCISDVLLISEGVSFREGDVVKEECILFLWLFVNHRYVSN